MTQVKQNKKYNFKIFSNYDRFGEPYYQITDYKNSYVKENVSFRLPFEKIIERAIEIYKQEEKENYLSF